MQSEPSLGSGPNNEYDMAISRIVITTTLVAGAALLGSAEQRPSVDIVSQVYFIYLCCAFGLFWHIYTRPRPNIARRAFALTIDISALTYASANVGPAFLALEYPAYLLIIYGYGFRFGVRWLIAAAAMSVAGALLIVAFSPTYQANSLMSGGLILGLIMTPTYAYRLVRNLWQAKARAEESDRAKSMFVAAVSHDLRTPLNAIIGLGDILAASKTTDEEADMARMIGDAGRALLGQINSILDLSRLQMGQTRADPEPTDLYALLSEVRDLLDVSAQAKRIRLTLTVEPNVPRAVVTRARNIRDSLTNLVGNAIKFTTNGSVDIGVRRLGSNDGSVRLRFEVRDTGIGVDAAAQRRIFERFRQADDSIRDRFGGSGLGLAIARELVRSLNGEIGVISAEGAGSTFWFEIDTQATVIPSAAQAHSFSAVLCSDDEELGRTARAICPNLQTAAGPQELIEMLRNASIDRAPAIIVDLDSHRALLELIAEDRVLGRAGVVVVAREGERIGGAAIARRAIVLRPATHSTLGDALTLACGLRRERMGAAKSKRPALSVLVVEDNRTNQKVVAKMLELAGSRAELADDGASALAILALKRFDVVLMDINMPVLDGVEATRRLRAREHGLERTPVVGLTADVTPETRARCLLAGMDECVTKPIDLPALLQLLDRLTPGDRETAALDDESANIVASASVEPERRTRVNRQALADLEQLGGRDFVRDVASQFVADAAHLLAGLAAAARESDISRFRDEAHALRSCSANVGAHALYQLCLSWRTLSAEDLGRDGSALVETLDQEFAAACVELGPWIDQAA
ncbi:MAG: response regulator [Hyphomicrobiales bacterium]|nr:response regulator [Hyphomicrobiales bacterium]